MSKPIRIAGILLLALMTCQMSVIGTWGELLAWTMALGVWIMSCIQQSRIDDAQRQIKELKGE